MANDVMKDGVGRGRPWRIVGWGTAAFLLLLPLVTNAPWTLSDYVVMGILLGSLGLAFEFLVRKSRSLAYRLGAALAAITGFLTLWINLAVGMIGSDDNPYNQMFAGVLLVGIFGAFVARFRAGGMALAMLVTAIAQAATGAFGLSADLRGGVLSMAFAGLWVLAAALFWNAARERQPISEMR